MDYNKSHRRKVYTPMNHLSTNNFGLIILITLSIILLTDSMEKISSSLWLQTAEESDSYTSMSLESEGRKERA